MIRASTGFGAAPWRTQGGRGAEGPTQRRYLHIALLRAAPSEGEDGAEWSRPDRGRDLRSRGVRKMPWEGTGEVTRTAPRGPFQHEGKCSGGGWGPSKGLGLEPRRSSPLPTPRFLHKMENSTGNFRAETPQGEQSQAGRVGTPPPHWPSCFPTRLRALPAQTPDRVCEAQAGSEFPVASWLAWCLALGRPGYRVCQGVSTCPYGQGLQMPRV